MFMRAVPPGATKCGHGSFTINGVGSAELARIAATFPTPYVTEQVWAVVLKGLEEDRDLLYQVSQMQRPEHGYTLDGAPSQLLRNTWHVPFTAYVFDLS